MHVTLALFDSVGDAVLQESTVSTHTAGRVGGCAYECSTLVHETLDALNDSLGNAVGGESMVITDTVGR